MKSLRVYLDKSPRVFKNTIGYEFFSASDGFYRIQLILSIKRTTYYFGVEVINEKDS